MRAERPPLWVLNIPIPSPVIEPTRFQVWRELMATSREAIAAIALLNPPTLGDRRQRWNQFGKPSPPCSYPDAKSGKMMLFVNMTGPPNGNDTVVSTL